MLCDICKTKDIVRGMKEIECIVCGEGGMVGWTYDANICKKCSDRLHFCASCGISISQVPSLLCKALTIAASAHDGQYDKGGVPYIWHPITVASMVQFEDEKIVALLHDVVEDGGYSLEMLKEMGFGPLVYFVDCLTRRDRESYSDYIHRVCRSTISINVKIADMKHNMDMSRIPEITKKDEKRLKKYKKWLPILEEELAEYHRRN